MSDVDIRMLAVASLGFYFGVGTLDSVLSSTVVAGIFYQNILLSDLHKRDCFPFSCNFHYKRAKRCPNFLGIST